MTLAAQPRNRLQGLDPQPGGRLNGAITPELTDGNGFLLPHVRTFNALYNTFSKVYSYRWDEAIRYGRQNADAMHRDAFLRSLEQERIMPLTGWEWDIAPDPDENDLVNPKDPYSVDREKVGKHLKAIIGRTPELMDQRRYLGLSSWFGRYGSQLHWGTQSVAGFHRFIVDRHKPIDGDKIAYDWEGTPGVMVRPGDKGNWPDVRNWDAGSHLAMLSRKDIRQCFVIQKYFIEDASYWEPQSAGRVEGVGYRDFCYWAWWLRDEMLSWLTDFMEKVGNLGLLVVYYEEGNPAGKTAAEATAKAASGKNAIAVPLPKGKDPKSAGVELIPANMTGVQFLKEVVGEYFERHIERLIVGQSMSSGADNDSGLGGTGRAALAKDTKWHLLRWDAKKQEECYTHELVATAKELNFPDAPWRYLWRYALPDPEADAKLAAVAKAATLPGKKLTFKADEVRGWIGATKPDATDEIVGGDEMPPGGAPGLPGPGGGPPQVGPDGQPVPVPGGPMPGAPGGAPGQPQQPAPVPGMAELVSAMVHAAADGDWQTVRELRLLGMDTKAMAGVLDDIQHGGTGAADSHTEAATPVHYGLRGLVSYEWSPAQTKNGHIKAIWIGAPTRRPLYGEEAEKALAGNKKQAAQEQPGEQRAPAQQPTQQAKPTGQEIKQGYAQLRAQNRPVIQKALDDPGSVHPHELPELALRLTTLTKAELRRMAEQLDHRTAGALKVDLMKGLIAHVRMGRSNADREGSVQVGTSKRLPTEAEKRADLEKWAEQHRRQEQLDAAHAHVERMSEWQQDKPWSQSAQDARERADQWVDRARAALDPTQRGEPKRWEEPTPDDWEAMRRAHESPKPGSVEEAAIEDLHVDPATFQFKLRTNAEGVTDELKGVQTWNPDFAGVISVWRDPATGKTMIVNGHHRYELAKRLGVKKLAVRYLDAKDAKAARAKGALINIAEGRGTAIDAAKFMRDMGVSVEDFAKEGVTLRSGALADQATALTRLNDKAFDRLTRGDLDQSTALAVAKHLADPARQERLFKLLANRADEGKEVGPRTVEEMARTMAAVHDATTSQQTLWGPEEHTEDTFIQRAELAASVRSELAKEQTDFAAVSSQRRASRVGEAGNVLAVDENKKRAESAEQAKNLYNLLANRKGPIADALNDGAKAIAQATTKKERDHARAQAADAVRAAVRRELETDPAHAPGEGGAVQGPERAPEPGSAQPAGIGGGAGAEPGGLAPSVQPPDREAAPAEASVQPPDAGPAAPPADFATQFHAAHGATDHTAIHDLIGAGLRGEHGPDVRAKVREAVLASAESGAGLADKYRRVAEAIGKPPAKPEAAEEPREPSTWLAPGGQRDIFGGVHRTPRPSPAADQQSLIPRDLERKADADALAEGMEKMRAAAQAVDAEAEAKAASPGPMTKEQARAVMETIAAPDRLPDNPAAYFNVDKADAHVPVSALKALRARPDGIENAAKFMEGARQGKLPKRDPVKVVDNGDGTYTVADGNSTYANAAKHGWDKLPVQFVSKEWLEAEQEKTRAKATKKAAEALKSEKLFHPEELDLPRSVRSAHTDPERLMEAAKQNKGTFDELIDSGKGVDKLLGATAYHAKSQREYLDALHRPGTVVIVGGLKGMARAAEKVHADFGGDWSQLHDVIRATVGVDHHEDLPAALVAIRTELANKGWELVRQPKNKFAAPTEAGYRDLNLVFRTADGTTGEIQVNTKPMLRAKEAAHPLYEEQRSIESRATLEGRDWTPEEQARHAALLERQKKLYDTAWHVSLGAAHADELSGLLRHAGHSGEEAQGGGHAGEDAPGRDVGAVPAAGAVLHPGTPSQPGGVSAAGAGVPAEVSELADAGKSPHIALSDAIAAKLKAGETLTAKDVFALADEHHGGTRAEGKYGPSEAYDSLEAGFNKALKGQTDPTADLADAQEQARQLAARVDSLPTQTNRSGNKDAFQQFSTPPHFAFAANWVANLRPDDVVLEPTAGTGSLAVHAANAGAKVVANELDETRAEHLRDQFGADAVHVENAEQIGAILPKKGVKPTVVVMNPPFSQTAGRMGDKKELMTGAKHIEEALATLPPGGRLVAIVAGGTARTGGHGSGMSPDAPFYRDWFGKIREKYNLRANVGVAGAEYKKYGTNFGTRLLVIDKSGPHQGETVTGDAADIPDLMAKLEGVRNDRPQATGPASGEPVRGPVAGAATASAGPPADAARADGAGVDAAPGEPGGVPQPVLGRADAGGGPAGEPAAGVRGVDAGERPGATERGPGGPGGSGAGVAGPGGAPGAAPGVAPKGARPGKGPRRKLVSGAPAQLPELRRPENVAIEVAQPGEKQPAAAAGATAPGGSQAPPSPGDQGTTNADLTASLYESYRPALLRIPGSVPHPSPLVESAAMAAVRPPVPTYRPMLSPDVVAMNRQVEVPNEDGSVSKFTVGLSEAGLESVVYAGQAHTKMLPAAEGAPAMRRGYFIGDGTGAGKGRQIAGVITDNWNQGRKKHVWITQKQSLINDARRDWRDLGNDPAHVVHFDEIRGGASPPSEGIAFITYATLRGGPKDPTAPRNIDELVKWLGPDFDGVVAFDEAHSMGNGIETEGSRGRKDASQQALAGIQLQKMLPNARVVYVSATGATEVSNLAYAERLGLWGRGTPFPTKKEFISQMEHGGVAAMEAVAQSLKATGGYAARSLSFNGVTYERLTHDMTPEQVGMYDSLADGWQKVLQNIDAALEASGGAKSGMAMALAKSQFWGAQQRFFNQVMTSMQTPSTIRAMEQDLAEGKSPVIQLVNTMEAATERARSRLEEGQDLESLDVSPRETLMMYLDQSFPIHRYEEYVDDDGNTRSRLVKDSAGDPVEDPEAVRMRDELLDMVGTLRIPESPLDMILNHFGHEKVAEATGRKERVIYKTNDRGERVKTIDRRPDTANTTEARAFQGGKKPIMVFSDAGGTGSSYHADRTAANQAQRIHYMLQPGWRADNAVQGLGRTHRTNQVAPPIYRLVQIDQLKSQKRFISTIARRLDQLGALTRGQRQAGSSGLFSAADNLESPQAKEAMDSFFTALRSGQVEGLSHNEVITQLGLKKDDAKKDRSGRPKPEVPESMGQFLNRLLSLRVDMQGKVFDAYEHHLQLAVERAEREGTLDTGVENFPAEKIVKTADQVVHTDADSGAEARLLSVKASKRTESRPWKKNTEGELPVGFVGNKSSGRLWAVYKGGFRTDAESGRVEQMYRLVSPTGASQFKPTSELDATLNGWNSYGRSHWEKHEEADARKRWEEELKDVPSHSETTEHFLTGAFLPIWDKIPGADRPKIYRLRTDDGQTVVGRHVPHELLPQLQSNLGLHADQEEHDAAEVHERMSRGQARARLSNGWILKPARVQNERRVEVDGVTPAHMAEFKADGGIVERVGYQTRFFIPVGEEGQSVLDRVLKSRNATITQVTDL